MLKGVVALTLTMASGLCFAQADRAAVPHDTWQMDASEQLRLGSGQGISWLRLVDEYSGAFLGTTVFPPLPLGPRQRGCGPAVVARRL